MLRRAALRTLTQGHLSQHLLFHSLHQTAVVASARRIFGVRTREEFRDLRRAELSPLQIGDLHGRTRTEMRRGVERALAAAAARGVRRGYLTPGQKRLLLDRQLRQVPRWLAQRRYNGPSGGRNRLDLPRGDGARRPGMTANGELVTWDAYRHDRGAARRLGEIHVQGAALAPGRLGPGLRAQRALRRQQEADLELQLGVVGGRVVGRVRERGIDVPARQPRRPDLDPCS